MKSISLPLLTFLLSSTNYQKADLYQVQLVNGQTIYATDAGCDLTYGGQKYYCTQYGVWHRENVTQEAKNTPESSSVTVNLICKDSVLFPGTSTPLMATLNAGLFDGAIVTILTVYWPTGQFPPPTS